MKQDLRFKKTERLIRQTALELLSKKSIEEITVGEICEKAEISRNTFYGHFEDKFSLLKKFSEDFAEELAIHIENLSPETGYENSIRLTAEILFEYLSEHEKLLRILSKNDPKFWDTFENRLCEIVAKYSDDKKTYLYSVYSCGATVNCLKRYFGSKIEMKPEEFVQYLTEIATECNSFMKERI